MTPAEVFENARQMSEGERLAAFFVCCGGTEKHPTSSLQGCYPSTANRYCDRCWTLFNEKKKPLNAPEMKPGIR